MTHGSKIINRFRPFNLVPFQKNAVANQTALTLAHLLLCTFPTSFDEVIRGTAGVVESKAAEGINGPVIIFFPFFSKGITSIFSN